jgi:hypothetical protein
LPNTITAIKLPLSHELYQQLAERRAVRSCEYGWVIERKNDPLEHYPWIKSAITDYYKQISYVENDKWRIRKYEKLTAAPC